MSAFSVFVGKVGWPVAGLVVFMAIYGFFFCVIFPQWHIYEQIAHSGTQTEGVVTVKEPMNHASIRYQYSVAGRSYSGSSTTDVGGIPRLEEIELGQKIPVAYFSGDPSLSVAGDPHETYDSWCGLLFIWMPLMIAAVAFGNTFAFKPSPTPSPE